MELPEITNRIKKLIEHFSDGNVADFVRLTKISSHQVLNRIFSIDKRSGKYPKPSSGILIPIQTNLTEINYNWLLTGEGPMLKSESNELVSIYKKEVSQVPEDDYMMVEYADLRTSAGNLGAISLEQIPENHKRLVPREYGNGNRYLVVRVDGNSMDDNTNRSLCDGDEILIKEYILHNGDKLPFRNNLFVISSNQGDVVKQIINHDTAKGVITCRSFNPNWEDYDISMEDIFRIFTVVKIVNRKPKF